MMWKRVVSLFIAVSLVGAAGQPAFAESGSTGESSGGSAEQPTEQSGVSADPETSGNAGTDGQAGTESRQGADPSTETQSDPNSGVTPNLAPPGENEPETSTPKEETKDPVPPENVVDPLPQKPTDAPDATQAAAPEKELEVSGVLRVTSDEPSQGSVGVVGTQDAAEMLPAQVKLQTDAGEVLPVDAASLGREVMGGERFSGSIVLGDAAQQAVQQEAVNSPAPGRSDVESAKAVEVAAAATIAEGDTFEVAAAEVSPAPAPAPAATTGRKVHSADVVFITDATTSQVAAIKDLMTLTSNYWKKESEGLVAGIVMNAVVQLKPGRVDACDPNAASEMARAEFPGVDHYSNARHLVVLVDKKCGPGTAAGWGDVYTLHGGGEVYVNLGSRFPNTPLRDGLGVVAHEFGHNFGLLHSGARFCDANAVDTWLNNVWVFNPWGAKKSGQLCTDDEYGDSWSVMGYYRPQLGAVIPSLPISQKAAIEVLPRGAIPVITRAGGKSQRFTLATLGAGGGLRGLQVQHSTGTESFYVEYRSGTGQDSGANQVDASQRGVRILKQYDRGSVVISTPDGSALSKGSSLQPYGGRARVTVESTTATEARVRVDFYTSFTDVSLSHKFANPIQWMYDHKLSTGKRQIDGSSKYGPEESVTRAAIAAFLFRSGAPRGYQAGAKGRLPFTDVSASHRFYTEIYWMWERGITTGTRQKNGTLKFLPESSLTREAMAAFLYRVNKARFTPPSKSPFVDIAPKHKFYTQISWMYAKKISTGVATNNGRAYRPGVFTTRADIAAFMQRASKL